MPVLSERRSMKLRLKPLKGSLIKSIYDKKTYHCFYSSLCKVHGSNAKIWELATLQHLIPHRLPCKKMANKRIRKHVLLRVPPNSRNFKNSLAPSANLSNLRISDSFVLSVSKSSSHHQYVEECIARSWKQGQRSVDGVGHYYCQHTRSDTKLLLALSLFCVHWFNSSKAMNVLLLHLLRLFLILLINPQSPIYKGGRSSSFGPGAITSDTF
jgi:hypothetical protein